MTIEEIKELITVVNDSGIAELEVQRGDNRVRIRRSNMGSTQEIVLAPSAHPMMAAPLGHPATPPAGTSSPAAASSQQPPPSAQQEAPITADTVYVKSPIVGTFYESSSPGSAPFVKVGDRVTPGQVLCIIESMKLMNEIESEVTGVIVSKLVENGRPVEYGESLFAVQPA